MNEGRLVSLMRRAVDCFAPPLEGLTVLTEAGSGAFLSTPVMAALGGAARTVAVTRDSRFGSAETIIADARRLADALGVADRIEFVTDDPRTHAGDADVVTNLGFVRPLDRAFVERMKPEAAVALMWEPWEFRPEDIDLEACLSRGIPVVGTNERDPRLRTFEHVGMLAAKLLLERDVEILGCAIAMIGGDPFGAAVAGVLERAGATVLRLEPGEAPDGEIDALVLVEHRDHRRLLIGKGGLDPARLAGGAVEVIHICGPVDDDAMARAGLAKHPPQRVAPGYMTVTTGHVGPKAVVDLHCAGLAVGATVARARRGGADGRSAVQAAVDTGLGLAMPDPALPA